MANTTRWHARAYDDLSKALDQTRTKNYTRGMAKHTVMQTGSAIRRARERQEWSQRELARRVGVTASTISGWERGLGRHGISVDLVERLRVELDLRLSDFGIDP